VDFDTIINYINNAVYKRDLARQRKESYINYASNSDSHAQDYLKEAEKYRSQAKEYENEELQAQNDIEYYQQRAEQMRQVQT
jgi:hypothetical protein